MSSNEIQQLAHLMRRAGFGATQKELEQYASIGYEASVDYLLDTTTPTAMSEYLLSVIFFVLFLPMFSSMYPPVHIGVLS